ncbi:MAG: hypothetical protein OEY10_00370 [Nitrosopumilus sp.]|nr:hypothetical protein [Nitrosopumilus sp.]
MATGYSRFLYNNLINTSTTITPSSVTDGIISSTLKDGAGSATMTTSGTYNQDKDLSYTIEIDDVTAGAEIAQATFKWKNSDSVGWEAEGVATAATPILLNNGVYITFQSGTGNDFNLYDKWYFKTVNRFSSSKLYDYDRDTQYRSVDASSTIRLVFDIGTAQTFSTLIIGDHNFTSGATILLEANATDSWGAPTFSESITWKSEKILQYLASSPTLRFVRLSITDIGNSDGFLKIGEIFLGEYFQPSKTIDQKHTRAKRLSILDEENEYGNVRKRFHGIRNTIKGTYSYVTDTDLTSFETMLTTITNKTAETINPVWYNLDANNTNDFWLMEFDTLSATLVFNNASVKYYNIPVDMIEVAKTSS